MLKYLFILILFCSCKSNLKLCEYYATKHENSISRYKQLYSSDSISEKDYIYLINGENEYYYIVKLKYKCK